MKPDESAPSGNSVEVSLPTDLSALAMLAQTIQDFGAAHALGEDLQGRLNLALDELITNSVSYALPEVAEPEMCLRLALAHGQVVAQIEDNGAEFDPFEEATEPDTSLGLTERKIGGLGVFLAKQLTDSSTYERVGDRNRITLQIVIGGQHSDE